MEPKSHFAVPCTSQWPNTQKPIVTSKGQLAATVRSTARPAQHEVEGAGSLRTALADDSADAVREHADYLSERLARLLAGKKPNVLAGSQPGRCELSICEHNGPA